MGSELFGYNIYLMLAVAVLTLSVNKNGELEFLVTGVPSLKTSKYFSVSISIIAHFEFVPFLISCHCKKNERWSVCKLHPRGESE